MPSSPPTRCAHCNNLVPFGERCECTTWGGESAQTRSWSHNRWNDPRWQKVRKRRLKIEPQCRLCDAVATEVDHIDHTSHDDDTGTPPSWLSLEQTRSLCTRCHRSRTSKQGLAGRTSRDYDGTS